LDDFGRLDAEHGRAEIAKLRRSLGGPMLCPSSHFAYAALRESAFSTKRTCRHAQRMSAIGGKADITWTWADVCF
jgi:hypothetical protein